MKDVIVLYKFNLYFFGMYYEIIIGMDFSILQFFYIFCVYILSDYWYKEIEVYKIILNIDLYLIISYLLKK